MNRYKKFYMDILGIEYVRADTPPLQYKSNLCSVVAMMYVTGLTFDEEYDLQAKFGKETGSMLNSYKSVLEPLLKKMEWKKIHNEEYSYESVGEFMYNHKKGEYVIFSSQHMEYYKDGTRFISSVDNNNECTITVNLDLWLGERVQYIWTKEGTDS